MAADLLDFEEPIGVLLKEIDALSMMPHTEARAADIARLRGRVDRAACRAVRRAHALADACRWRATRTGRARSTTSSGSSPTSSRCTATAGSPTTRPSCAGWRGITARPCSSSGTRRAGRRRRRSRATSATPGRKGTARRCARCGMAEKFQRPIIVFVDTPAAYPGHRVGRARRRRSHRAQPPGNGRARGADRRRRVRRGRQRRRAGHRDRRPRAHAAVRHLQRHPAGRLLRDSLA